jgi:hypothetical protein
LANGGSDRRPIVHKSTVAFVWGARPHSAAPTASSTALRF